MFRFSVYIPLKSRPILFNQYISYDFRSSSDDDNRYVTNLIFPLLNVTQINLYITPFDCLDKL